MVYNTNYTFNTSISIDNYFTKAECSAAIGGTREERKELGIKLKIGFMEQTVTAQQLLDKCLNGHTFCNLFDGYKDVFVKGKTLIRKTDNAFTMTAKADDYFYGSYTISIDIDEITKYDSVSDFISALSYKPTFYNTTYNHLQSNKGIRLRLVYVFDELIFGNDYGWFYRYVSNKIVSQIEKDTNENIDSCSLKASQYYNGTNVNNKSLNVEYGITNIIYSFSDFDLNDKDFFSFLKTNKTKVNKNKEQKKQEYIISYTTYYNDLQKTAPLKNVENDAIKSDISSESKVSDKLLLDMSRLEYDEFMKYNRNKYEYFYRYENYTWINGNGFKWAYIDENYFSLYYNVNTVKDGSKRRKKVFERMCLRRIINPNVDADTIAFNAYEDIHRFFDNSDNVLNTDYIQRNVERCFELSLEEIKDMYSDNISYLKSKKPIKGKIYKFFGGTISNRNIYIHTVEISEIMSYYNCDMTIKDNLEYINNIGIKVSEKTLYNYLKKLGLSNKKAIEKKKGEKEEYIKSLINDRNCSKRKFRETLNDLNIKLSDKKILEYLKEYKDNNNNTYNSTTYYNDLQKTAPLIFEQYNNIKSDYLGNSENTDYITISNLEKEGLILFNTNFRYDNNYYY